MQDSAQELGTGSVPLPARVREAHPEVEVVKVR